MGNPKGRITMTTADALIDEWIKTRERLVEHIRSLQPMPKLHVVGNPIAEAHERSLELLTGWQTDLDELVAGLLMDTTVTDKP
jgi:hypothetical protein